MILFVVPFDVRSDRWTYEWIVYRAASRMKSLGLMMEPHFWNDVEDRKLGGAFATSVTTQEMFRYKIPSTADLNSRLRLPLSASALEEVLHNRIGPGPVWKSTILDRIPALEADIRDALLTAGTVDAVLTWTNCASLKAVCRELDIPLIHNELGPTRAPYFHPTAYFDFEGVTGGTDAERRWGCFRSEGRGVPVLQREELLDLLSASSQKADTEGNSREVGVALQVPDDSTMLAFSRGFDNHEVIATCLRYLPGRPLVRPHPAKQTRFTGLAVDWDENESAHAFLNQVGSVVTCNSSLAFEAMLLGKPAYVLGESPFSIGAHDIRTQTPRLSRTDMLLWLNWIVFGYLIHFDLTFDETYYHWRLSKPTETEIYLDNFERWTGSEVRGYGVTP